MRSLQEALGRELAWRRRGLLSNTYDLIDPAQAEAEPWATLVRGSGLRLRAPAQVRSGDGNWEFRRVGLFRARVLVLAPEGTAPLATLTRAWRGGVLRFEDGREFVWRREASWRPAWRFEDGNGITVIRLHRDLLQPLGVTRVAFESSAAPGTELTLLACLGWYLVLLGRRRATAVRA
jgi:hypothetical protein